MALKFYNGSFKAQFWSSDLIFSVVIFSFALTILAYTWFNIGNQLASAYSGTSIILQLQAQTLVQNLMTTGAPANWQSTVDTTNVMDWRDVSVGLASTSSNSSISTGKLYALISMANYNYPASKQPLGVAFDYYITIVGSPGSANTINIGIGRNPSTNIVLAEHSQRISATLNGVPVIVTVTVWTNTNFALG